MPNECLFFDRTFKSHQERIDFFISLNEFRVMYENKNQWFITKNTSPLGVRVTFSRTFDPSAKVHIATTI